MTDEDELQGRLEDYKEPIEEDEDLGAVLTGKSYHLNLLSQEYWLEAARKAEANGDLEEAEMIYAWARIKNQN